MARRSRGWNETVPVGATNLALLEHPSDEDRALRLMVSFSTAPDLTIAGPVVARVRVGIDGALQFEQAIAIVPQGLCLHVPAGHLLVSCDNPTDQTAQVTAQLSSAVPSASVISQQVTCVAGAGNVRVPIVAFARSVFVKPQSADVQCQYVNGAKGTSVAVSAADGYLVGLGDGWATFELDNLGVIDTQVRLDWSVFR